MSAFHDLEWLARYGVTRDDASTPVAQSAVAAKRLGNRHQFAEGSDRQGGARTGRHAACSARGRQNHGSGLTPCARRAGLELELVPVPSRPSFYAAMLGGRLLCRSRMPLLDAARVLLAEGITPETELAARHVGRAIVAMRSTVGEAAKWTIRERDRGGLSKELWQSFEMGRSSTPVAPENARGEMAAPEVPADIIARSWASTGAAAP